AAAPPPIIAPPPLAPAAAPGQPPTDFSVMPAELAAFLRELESWVQANAADATRATVRFWPLKVPAALSSGASAILALLGLKLISAIAGAIAGLCVVVDGVNPGGLLRNAFLRAVHELRELENDVLSRWRVGTLRGEEPQKLAADILEGSRSEYKRIAEELRIAETAFHPKV